MTNDFEKPAIHPVAPAPDLPQWVAIHAAHRPEAVAVVFQTQQLTYRELDLRANQVAGRLQQLGIGPDMLVGLSVESSLEMIIGLLAILKAGGAFVPLDPTYPTDRLSFLVTESGVSVILTTTVNASHLPSPPAKLVYLDELPDHPSSTLDFPIRNSLAACLYTSGSTGQPKGVLLEHSALANHAASLQQAYQLTPADRVLQFAPLNHIAGVEQILITWLVGACLVLREPKLWTPLDFPAKVQEYGLTVCDLPSGYYQVLVESLTQQATLLLETPLRLMIVGGEVTSPTAVNRWQQSPLQAIRLLNVYGMTEVAGTATLFEVTETPLVERVPIGRPLTGRTTYLLDEQLQPVRAGEVGELHIGGPNLACGYLNQPELTQTRFIPDPFSATEGARLYKTGDLASSLPDGNLEYLGRLDHQVSLRGFRIELGEIEGVLKQHSTVQDAAVITQGTGTAQRLVAYVVPQTGELTSPMQNFWHPDHQYRDQAGVLTNPLERLAFKLKQHNLRTPSATRISLPKPKVDDQFQQPYLARQSYRQFLNQPISLEQFSHFLSCLLQLNLPDTPIPKYRYPSALGLYAVQTYLYLKPGKVAELTGGFYYYHPGAHELELMQPGELSQEVYLAFDQPTYLQAGLALFLVAHLEAITPIYGIHLAREFSLLEAGYLGQLLMTEAPNYGLGLCPIGLLEDQGHVKHSFGLTENQVIIHSFLGGAIAPAQTQQWLQPVASQKSPAQLKTELHAYLTAKLPGQMVPDSWVLLEKMPLTPNGKINRQALPAPTDSHIGLVLPRTPLEEMIADLWREVLKLQQVSVEDNFFEVGGNSLTALQLLTKIRQAFRVDLSLQDFLTHNTVAKLATQLESLRPADDSSDFPAVIPAPETRYEPFPLTDIQEAYWLGRSNLFELSTATQSYLEIECQGFDPQRLNHAWQQLINRHEMLRAVILPSGEQQILAHTPPYQIDTTDLTTASPAAITAHLANLRHLLFERSQPAEQWPLFEVRFTLLPDQRLRIHLAIDMLISDWGSSDLLLREWAHCYHHPDVELPRLTLSFRDYVWAERRLLETAVYQRSRDYWSNRLATFPAAPELPLALDPATLPTPRFKRYQQTLSPTDWSKLQAQANQIGLTPTGILLTAFAEVLTVFSKRPQFTINLTLFNRLPLAEQVNQIVGDFTSLTLLAVDHTNPTETLLTRAKRLQAQLWQDLDHRYFSGLRVLRTLATQREGTGRTLMPVVFTSGLGVSEKGAGWLGREVYGLSQTPQVWLDSQAEDQAGTLWLTWDVVEELFPAGLIDAMFKTYLTLLERLAGEAGIWSQTTLNLLPPAQLAQRQTINATSAPVSAELLHTLFLKQAQQQSGQIAVIAVDRTLTYGELAVQASQVGQWLQEAGAQPNTLVAVVMHKGWEQVVAVLGILMSGAAYLPIDPELPTERQHYLLAQGGVKLALTQPGLNQTLTWPVGIQRFPISFLNLPGLGNLATTSDSSFLNLPGLGNLTDLAYCIYTSGSTGLPKGVMIDHRGAVNTILDINHRFGVTAQDRVLALSALNFDLSVYDLFGLLAAGGTIVMPAPTGLRDPSHWATLMTQHGVTVWDTVPALMQMLVEYQAGRPFKAKENLTGLEDLSGLSNGSLRLVMMSGDWIPLPLPNQIRQLWPNVQLMSLGGATEASIWSIYYPITAIDPTWQSIPYGKPLANQTFHVLNERLEPCPVWVPGQLYIGGIGLALGYWRDDTKTAASFITHPVTGERLYKTGDLGRYRPDGNIEFLGREDFQVKIRGHRIELGEIESHLVKHPAVKEAIVAVVGPSREEKQLVAYLIPSHSPQTATSTVDQAAYGLPVMQGVLTDPLERFQFKLQHPGIRQFETVSTSVSLPLPTVADSAYIERQSYRHFQPTPVTLAQLGELLGCLSPRTFPEAILPKYRYGSAGSLYPVQTYLYIKPDRVAGVAAGTYYYHPLEHRLILIAAAPQLSRDRHGGTNQVIFDQSAFSLFLVADLAAITRLSRDFCLLEAGYMSQLLMTEATAQDLGLCPIGGMDFEPLRHYLALGEKQEMVHSFLGGGISPAQKRSLPNSEDLDFSSNSKELDSAGTLESTLKTYLGQRLPGYMVPNCYLTLEQWPLTPNGKVDRQALPLPDTTATVATIIGPETEWERQVADVVQTVLARREPLSVTANLLDLGADSVDLIQIYSRLKAKFAAPLTIADIFRRSSVRALAQYLTQAASAKEASREIGRL